MCSDMQTDLGLSTVTPMAVRIADGFGRLAELYEYAVRQFVVSEAYSLYDRLF